MRYEENHEALENSTAKDSADLGAQETAEPLSPFTKMALSIAVAKVRDGLRVEADGIFKCWDIGVRLAIEDTVSKWLNEQFDAYLRKDKVYLAGLEDAFTEVLNTEIAAAIRESAREEALCALQNRDQW